jgi:hypothetical protein
MPGQAGEVLDKVGGEAAGYQARECGPPASSEAASCLTGEVTGDKGNAAAKRR